MYAIEPFVDKVWKCDPVIREIMSTEQYQAIQEHNFKARDVCTALRLPTEEFRELWDHERERIYGELADILDEYPRLALYLPFYVLENPTKDFRSHYHEAWLKGVFYRDVREAFHLGDIYEESLMRGEPERVTKSMHLIPWLLRYGYITEDDVIQYARAFQNEKSITIWGINDGVNAAYLKSWIGRDAYKTVHDIVEQAKCPRPNPPELLAVTEERRKWLAERENGYNVNPNEFKLRNPTGPFFDNIDYASLENIKIDSEHEFVILYGSRLKGYGRPDSDHDLYTYDAISGTIKEFPEMSELPEMVAHLIMFGAWVGLHGEPTRQAQLQAASRYYKLNEKSRVNSLLIEEKSVLQYRLMHKGMVCAYPDISMETRQLKSIDGGSAFYDDRYRTIASQLYLKYIHLPPRG